MRQQRKEREDERRKNKGLRECRIKKKAKSKNIKGQAGIQGGKNKEIQCLGYALFMCSFVILVDYQLHCTHY